MEISGLPYGTESNPPAWDHRGGVVVAYDAGNAVLRGVAAGAATSSSRCGAGTASPTPAT